MMKLFFILLVLLFSGCGGSNSESSLSPVNANPTQSDTTGNDSITESEHTKFLNIPLVCTFDSPNSDVVRSIETSYMRIDADGTFRTIQASSLIETIGAWSYSENALYLDGAAWLIDGTSLKLNGTVCIGYVQPLQIASEALPHTQFFGVPMVCIIDAGNPRIDLTETSYLLINEDGTYVLRFVAESPATEYTSTWSYAGNVFYLGDYAYSIDGDSLRLPLGGDEETRCLGNFG